MPKFDISTVADGHTSRERVVFPNLEAAAEEVQRALVDMADERLPDGSALNLATEVRDEDGRSLYRALLQFRAQTADEIEASERQAEKDFASLSQDARDQGRRRLGSKAIVIVLGVSAVQERIVSLAVRDSS
jgi:nucleotide-binding universal stress UspA family protein